MSQDGLVPGTKYIVSVGNKTYPVTLKAEYYLSTPSSISVPEWNQSGKLMLGSNSSKAIKTIRSLTQKKARNNTRRGNLSPVTRADLLRADQIINNILTTYDDGDAGYSITKNVAIKESDYKFGSNKMNKYFTQKYSYMDPDGSIFAKY